MADETKRDFETLGRDPFADLGLGPEPEEDEELDDAPRVVSEAGFETLGRDPFADLDWQTGEVRPLAVAAVEETQVGLPAYGKEEPMPGPVAVIEPPAPSATYDFDIEPEANALYARRPEVLGQLRGCGVWLQYSGNIDWAIEMANAIGATHIFYKTAHRGMFFVEGAPRVYDRIRRAGLIPFAWLVTHGDNPLAEARAAVKSAKVGYEGIVFHVEDAIRGKSVGVATLGRQVVAAGIDPHMLYYTSYPNIWQNLDIPYQEMNAFCRGGFMPLCFPFFERTPRTVIGKWAYGEHARWAEEWGNMPPLYPVVAAYKDRDATRQLTAQEFLEWAQVLAAHRPAFFSVYRAETTHGEVWPVLAALSEGPPEPVPSAPSVPEPEPEPALEPSLSLTQPMVLDDVLLSETQAVPSVQAVREPRPAVPQPAPKPRPAPRSTKESAPAEHAGVYHDVTVNDTVWSLCKQYAISRAQFWDWNGYLWDETGKPRDILYLQEGWRVRVG
ncbi:MAG: hypothetical protein JXD18_05005 [Anaerolineae bacterium]|nr:hypothetical protein [Anaerolineae bacterium]